MAAPLGEERLSAAPAITLEVLPAGYGDCLLVTCPVPRGNWRMLVDAGPDECWPALRDRLLAIPPDAAGQRRIDLLVVTHIDHDHIGAVQALLQDRSLGLVFGDVWFNAPPPKARRGVKEGQTLADWLGVAGTAGASPLPWNQHFGGGLASTAGDGGFVEGPAVPDQPRITLLSPTPARLAELFKVWDRELEKLRRKETEPAPPAPPATRAGERLDPAALSARVTAVDKAPPNGSSIAFLLEHRGASVLLAADAFPAVLSSALQALARHRGRPGSLKVDAFKLSHHGSRANLTVDLLQAVQADHYIVSTNGAIFRHPDDEAVARVVMHGGRHPTLWFNHRNERSLRWADPQLQLAHGYRTELPPEGKAGVVLKLAAAPGQEAGGRGSRARTRPVVEG